MADESNNQGASAENTEAKGEAKTRKAKSESKAQATEDLRSVAAREKREREDAEREIREGVQSWSDSQAHVVLDELCKRFGVKVSLDSAHGKSHTGKYVARVGLKVQPQGEEKVRTVKPGESVSLSEADVKFYLAKQPPAIEPELV